MNKLKSSCPLCHGGNKQTGTTTFTVELGFGVVVIRVANWDDEIRAVS